MLRKLMIGAPLVGALILAAPGWHETAHSAPFTSAPNISPALLATPAGGHGGGARWFPGGGGGGGGFHGSGGPAFHGGPRFNGGTGFMGKPSFHGPAPGGSSSFVRRPNFAPNGSWKYGNKYPPKFAYPPKFGGGNFDYGRHHKHRHHRFVRGFYWGPDYYSYDDGYGYGYDDCAWLKEKALYTGSLYWWKRYRYCEYGYGY